MQLSIILMVYISPHFNKQLRFQNITKKNLEIIGSAHNAIELKIKEKQGCSGIFF